MVTGIVKCRRAIEVDTFLILIQKHIASDRACSHTATPIFGRKRSPLPEQYIMAWRANCEFMIPVVGSQSANVREFI
jgi:hypothetical protein